MLTKGQCLSLVSLCSDVKSGTPSGSGSSIEGVNGGAVEKVATKSGVDSDVHKYAVWK